MILLVVVASSLIVVNAQISNDDLIRQTKFLKEKCDSAPFKTYFTTSSLEYEHTITCFVAGSDGANCDGAIKAQPQVYRTATTKEVADLKLKGLFPQYRSDKLCIFETYLTTKPLDRYTCDSEDWTLQAMPKGNPRCFMSGSLSRTESYDQIKQRCAALGARVVDVQHGLDELGIYTSMKKLLNDQEPTDAIYIGLTNRNGWKWEDNTPLKNFHRYLKGQPSQSGQESCTVQSFGKEGWDDYFCDCSTGKCPGTHQITAYTCVKDALPPKQPGSGRVQYKCDDPSWIIVHRAGGQHPACFKAKYTGLRYYTQMIRECAEWNAVLAPMQSSQEEIAFKDSLQDVYGARQIGGYVYVGMRNTNPIRTIPGATFVFDYDGLPLASYKRWLEPDPNVDQNSVMTDFERCNEFDFHWNGWRDWYCSTENTIYKDWYTSYYAVCAKPANINYR